LHFVLLPSEREETGPDPDGREIREAGSHLLPGRVINERMFIVYPKLYSSRRD